jgi:Meckel syndrome type 1 protein
MNPNTPPPGDDDLPDERELATLYARLPRVEPSPELDAAVHAAAMRAQPRRRSRWPLAIGSAAVLVLAVGMGWHLGREPVMPPAARSLPPPPAQGTVTPDAIRVVEPPPSPVLDEAAPPSTPMAVRKSARTQRIESAPAPSPAAPPAADAVPSFAPALRMQRAMPMKPSAQILPSSLPPDDRVAYIRHLLDQGRRDEARRETEALRRSHPRYELPQDLLDLLR